MLKYPDNKRNWEAKQLNNKHNRKHNLPPSVEVLKKPYHGLALVNEPRQISSESRITLSYRSACQCCWPRSTTSLSSLPFLLYFFLYLSFPSFYVIQAKMHLTISGWLIECNLSAYHFIFQVNIITNKHLSIIVFINQSTASSPR